LTDEVKQLKGGMTEDEIDELAEKIALKMMEKQEEK
jgi:hypothetical protein